MRQAPNIMLTGTPGVGKTTHCESLAERTGLRHISINQVVKDKGCHEGWNEEYQSWIVDEDKVRHSRLRPELWRSWFQKLMRSSQLLDAIEKEVHCGGCIIDWHACDLFPRSWLDLVVVLRVDSSTLFDRLTGR